MTVPPNDPPAMWFKQVPNNDHCAEGVWSQSLLDNHFTVARSYERPKATVDAVTFQEIKAAAHAVLREDGDLKDSAFKRLHDALLAERSRKMKEHYK